MIDSGANGLFDAGANGLIDAVVNELIDAGLNGVGLTDAGVDDAGLIDADGSSFPGGSQLPGVAAVGASSWLQGCRDSTTMARIAREWRGRCSAILSWALAAGR